MRKIRELYFFIERTFFYTLDRKLFGNLSLLLVFQIATLLLFFHVLKNPANAKDYYNDGIKLAVLSSIAFIFTAGYMRYLIVRPVKEILDKFNRINDKQGDLSARLPVFTYDEFRLVSIAYNKFVSDISGLLAEINDHVINANIENNKVVNTVGRTLEMSVNQEKLSKDIAESSTQVEQSLTEISDGSQILSKATQGNLENAEQTKQKLSVLVNQFHNIAKLLSGFDETVNNMQENAENIRKILSMVEDFSDQTNLLALNAAIEAARAGEAGRGFAVVADEVRTLSVKVNEATSQINAFINDMEQLVNETKHESSKLIDESEDAEKSIQAATQEFSSMVQEFKNNYKELEFINERVSMLNNNHRTVQSTVQDIAILSAKVRLEMNEVETETKALMTKSQTTQDQLKRFAI